MVQQSALLIWCVLAINDLLPLQFTSNSNRQHAYAASHLLPYLLPGGRVLDVGSGSGYLSAVLYHLIEDPQGQKPSSSDSDTELKPLVIGIEHVSELTDWSISNLKRDGLGEALEKGQIEMVTGDGRLGSLCSYVQKVALNNFHPGYPSNAPYDAIHVGAAAPELPQALVEQLAPGGRIFIPVSRQTLQCTSQVRLFSTTLRPTTRLEPTSKTSTTSTRMNQERSHRRKLWV